MKMRHPVALIVLVCATLLNALDGSLTSNAALVPAGPPVASTRS
jgi:hypothetical protein